MHFESQSNSSHFQIRGMSKSSGAMMGCWGNLSRVSCASAAPTPSLAVRFDSPCLSANSFLVVIALLARTPLGLCLRRWGRDGSKRK